MTNKSNSIIKINLRLMEERTILSLAQDSEWLPDSVKLKLAMHNAKIATAIVNTAKDESYSKIIKKIYNYYINSNDTEGYELLSKIASCEYTPSDILEKIYMKFQPDYYVCRQLAGNSATPLHTLLKLLEAEDCKIVRIALEEAKYREDEIPLEILLKIEERSINEISGRATELINMYCRKKVLGKE